MDAPTGANNRPAARANPVASQVVGEDPAGLNPTATIGTPDAAGTVTGVVTATQIADYPLVFSGTGWTTHGYLDVNPDGTFTYRPTAAARYDAATGGPVQDSVTITVDDLNGDTAVLAVDLPVSPSTDPLGLNPAATLAGPNQAGMITGAITTTPVDLPLGYSGSTTTAKGTVVVNPDGTFTYTPTPQARRAATATDAASTGADHDTFTITVNAPGGEVAWAGTGPIATTEVTVAISPLPALNPTATIGTPDAAGTVTGVVTATQIADYPLVFSGSTTTAKGTVVVNPAGTLNYTPTPQARLDASAADAANRGAGWDSFVISVDGGDGFVESILVTVPVAASDIADEVRGAWYEASLRPDTGGTPGADAADSGSLRATPSFESTPMPDAPVLVEPAPVVNGTADASKTASNATSDPNADTHLAAGPSRSGADDRNRHWTDRSRPAAPAVHPMSAGLTPSGPAAKGPPKPGGPGPLARPLSQTVVIQLQVALFALATMLGGEPLLRGLSGLAVPASSEGSSGGRLAAVRAGKFARDNADHALGDRSRSWRWPGTKRIDAALRTISQGLAPHSPLLARIVVDGSAVRAMFGAAGLLLPVAGVALGTAALRNTSGLPTPPSGLLLTAIAVLAVFDALAGFLAVVTFVAGVVLSGQIDSTAGIRTMLGLAVIWFAVPIIAGAARPLRRAAARSVADWRAWVGDLVIASLVGAWAVQKMVTALPGLAGVKLPIAAQATQVALAVLAACALRIVLEASAARWYPARLGEVQPADLRQPPTVQRIAAAFGRTALLAFVVSAFLGISWQLWAGAALFLVPQVISVFDSKFPNFPTLYRFYPRGIIKLVLMLVAGLGISAVVHRLLEHSAHPALDSFVLLSIPGAILSIVEVFGREGPSSDETWPRWLAGAGFVCAGVWLVVFVL